MLKSKNKPSKWLYALGILIFVIGILITVQVAVTGIDDLKEMERFIVPGQHELFFDKPDEFNLNYEYKSYIDNQFFNTPKNLTGLKLSLVNSETDEEVELIKVPEASAYLLDDREGIPIYSFKISKPGKYQLSAGYENKDGTDIVLAIGKGTSDFVLIVFIAVGIMLTSSVLGILILGYTYLGRK